MTQLGVTPTRHGIDVAVASENASLIELCLFDADDRETARHPLVPCEGGTFRAHVPGVAVGSRYGLRAHGPWDPARGLLFNPAKLLIDPYAIRLDRAPRFHPAQRGSLASGARDPEDSAPSMAKAIVEAPAAARLLPPITPLAATVLYELHVRGFTRRHPGIPEPLRGTFAALAHPAALAHWRRIGVTTLELMPVAAAIEEPHLAALGLTNYWGYNPVALLAPDPRLAPGGWEEVRATTAALHAAGIETVLDVVLNHSGEGDLAGPTLSLRGLDNPVYFRLLAGGLLANDTGCGNTLALDHPPMLRLALDALRAWALWGGVQGFRFDLATTLARTKRGFDPGAPFLQAVMQDPVLSRLKLIAEPWDVGWGGWQTGRFPAPFAEWNDRFRDEVRHFWRGDAQMIGKLATRLAGSADLFAGRGAAASINFVTAHDGFTLADLVSHRHKHNYANGEDNRDGTDDNTSWNNGVEGASADPEVAAQRRRDQAALLATLLLARGTPMLSQGAELGHSQGGNNNAYAQDNALTWLDWERADAALIAMTAALTAFRARHDWAWQGDALQGDTRREAAALHPDVAWFGVGGAPLSQDDWRDPAADLLVMVRTEPRAAPRGGRFAVVLTRSMAMLTVRLPPARSQARWRLSFGTASGAALEDETLRCPARSVLVLEEQADRARGGQAPDDATLRRLATAAGIGTAWHDVGGREHAVPPPALRALLDGLGFPAATAGDAEASLMRLAEEQRRRLPRSHAVRQNRAAGLPVVLAAGANEAPLIVEAVDEAGETLSLRLRPDRGETVRVVTPEGAEHRVWHAALPSLPAGRYRLVSGGVTCALTVAPETCHQPLQRGVIGLTAQLYALRRRGDQGIGDFTTLAQAARFAATHGAALLGINPLHALFPNDRERASPYNPSDRRFLDPLSIDLEAPDPGLEAPEARRLLADHAAEIAALSAAAGVDYRAVWRIKRRVLAAASRDSAAFAQFRAQASPSLREFALFSAISDAHPEGSWQNWPRALRDRDASALAEAEARHAEAVDFHLYLQFLAEAGLARAAGAGLSLGLLRDLAVGAAGDGAECWANPTLYVQSASIGAPPDPLAPQGQVWALPPPNPHAWRAAGFAPFIALVQANMRHAGALRIDHVLGLRRLFWVPNGAPPGEGAYVAAPMDNLFAELALESQRARAMVIGEDLGTVPPGLREAMADHAIFGNRVLLLDYEAPQGFPPASDYPRQVATAVASHDMPTLRGWRQGADIAERAEIGLFDPATAARERRVRADALLALERVAGGTDAAAVHAHVARTPSLIATAQIEDLAGETVAVNLPGTDRERPNWRRKISVSIEEMPARVLEAMREERK